MASNYWQMEKVKVFGDGNYTIFVIMTFFFLNNIFYYFLKFIFDKVVLKWFKNIKKSIKNKKN
jgi:hypothetical protein